MTSRRLLKSLTVVFVILFIGWPAQGQDQASWPMFQYDPAHTGLAPVVTPEELTLRWKAACDIGAATSHHLVIGPEDTIWVISGSKATAVTTDGDVKIGFVRPGDRLASFESNGSAAVGRDGRLIGLARIITGGADCPAVLFAASADGELQWAVELDGDTGGQSLLTLGPDGAIYVGLGSRQVADRNRLCVVSQDGELLWSYTPPEPITTIPAIDPEGNVYFGCRGGLLYCLDSSGNLKWSFDQIVSTFAVGSAPTIDEAGNIYYFANLSGFVVLAPDGGLKLHYPVRAYSYTSPVLLPGGSVGFLCSNPDLGSATTLFTRLGPDGQEEWTAQLSGSSSPLCSPVADAAGNVFVSGQFGAIYEEVSYLVRFSPQGTLATICTTANSLMDVVSGPCIGADGTVYVYLANALHAFGEPGQMLDLGISTRWAGRHIELGDIQSASIRLTNPGSEVDADCYVAYRRIDSDELFFYPFWSTDPGNCALEFRPKLCA